MAETEGISLEVLRALAERAGLNLTTEELEALKPLYEGHIKRTAVLQELELDAEDMAVTFSPLWDPRD